MKTNTNFKLSSLAISHLGYWYKLLQGNFTIKVSHTGMTRWKVPYSDVAKMSDSFPLSWRRAEVGSHVWGFGESTAIDKKWMVSTTVWIARSPVSGTPLWQKMFYLETIEYVVSVVEFAKHVEQGPFGDVTRSRNRLDGARHFLPTDEIRHSISTGIAWKRLNHLHPPSDQLSQGGLLKSHSWHMQNNDKRRYKDLYVTQMKKNQVGVVSYSAKWN